MSQACASKIDWGLPSHPDVLDSNRSDEYQHTEMRNCHFGNLIPHRVGPIATLPKMILWYMDEYGNLQLLPRPLPTEVMQGPQDTKGSS